MAGVVFDSTSKGQTGFAATVTWTHTMSAAAGGYIVLLIGDYQYPYATTPTYGGVAMTKLGAIQTGTNAYTAVWGLANPPAGANTFSISPPASTASSAMAVSFTGVTSVSFTATPATGTSATPSVTYTGATANDMVWAGLDTTSATTAQSPAGDTQVANGGYAGTSTGTQWATGTGSPLTFTSTINGSSQWAYWTMRLLGGPSNYTGGAATTTTATPAATGVRGASVGATTSVTATATAAGTRAASGGASTTVSLGGSASGQRAASSQAATTVFATTAADGSVGGRAATTIGLATTADGVRGANGTAETDVDSPHTAAGGLSASGIASTTVVATPAAAGPRGAVGSASTTVGLTNNPVGHTGEVAGASTVISVTHNAGGAAASRASTTVGAVSNADGVVTRAPRADFDLNSLDPWEAFVAADRLAEKRQADDYLASPQFEIDLYTNVYGVVGQITDYVSATATFTRNGVPTATIVLKGDDPLVDYALQCYETVVPITVSVNGMRWSGRVDTASDDEVDGVTTVTLQCLGDWNWLNKILVWPNSWLPIEIQIPKEAVYVGSAIKVVENMINEQVIRLQSGRWELVNNITDPAAWFATMMQHHGLLTPCAVVPSDALHDTSKTVAVSGRMDTIATLVDQICKDNGILITCELWLPGEPQPTDAFTLTVPTIVIRVQDKSGVTGPTGTFIDGLLEDAADLLDSAFGESIKPFLNPNNEYAPDGVNIAPAFGIDFTPPWPIYNCDNPRSGIKECHTNYHHPLAYTVIGGGKSPSWVNKLIDVLLEAAIGAILAAASAVSAGAAAVFGAIPNTLLDGVFDDVLLAFQQIENADRRTKLGPYGYPEYFTSTGSTAWTLDEWFALEIAMWDSRGYVSGQIIAYDGTPYTIGRDYKVGDLVSWIRRGRLFTDYVDEATVTDDRQNRVHTEIKIGDGSAQEAPWTKLQRKISGFESAMQIALLSGN